MADKRNQKDQTNQIDDKDGKVVLEPTSPSPYQIRTLQAKGYLVKDKADEMIERYEEVIRGINGYKSWVRKKKGTKK